MKINQFKLGWVIAGIFAITLALGCASNADKYAMEEPPPEDYYLADECYGLDDGVGGGYDAPMEKSKEFADMEYEEAAEEAIEMELPSTGTVDTDITTEGKITSPGKKTEKLMIIKTADMSFEVKKVEDASNEVLAIASKYNAIIVDSHKYKDDDGHSFATTSIRVEPQYVEKLIADL